MSWKRGIWLLLVLSALRVELFAQTEVFFSQPGGFYNESFALFLSCNDWERQIRYTTNGDTPTANSNLYEAPLFLDEHLYSTSDIYTLPIAPVFEPYEPDSVRHAIVIRAAAFDDEGHRIREFLYLGHYSTLTIPIGRVTITNTASNGNAWPMWSFICPMGRASTSNVACGHTATVRGRPTPKE